MADILKIVAGSLVRLPSAFRASAQALQLESAAAAAQQLARSRSFTEGLTNSNALSGLSAALNTAAIDDPTIGAAIGVGEVSLLADRERYARVTGKLHHVHATLERALDKCTSPIVRPLWEQYGAYLARTELIRADLEAVGAYPPAAPSLETACYIQVIEQAAAEDEALLLGHVHSRFVAELAGGASVGWLYRRALGLEAAPARLVGGAAGLDPRERLLLLDDIFGEINRAGQVCTMRQEARIVESARAGCRATSHLYHEEEHGPRKMLTAAVDGARGVARASFGPAEEKAPRLSLSERALGFLPGGSPPGAGAEAAPLEASTLAAPSPPRRAELPNLSAAEARALKLARRTPTPPRKHSVARRM
jgi:hypothetical protein